MAGRYAYANSLRVVGQLLQQRDLDVFDLKHGANEFFLQCGSPIPPYLHLTEFSCSVAEIKALDAKARAHRDGSFKRVDFESLPEIFRAIGRRLDERDGQLLRLCNADFPSRHESITVEYRTRDQRRHFEELIVAALGDQAMRMYKNRLRSHVNPSRND